MNNKVYFTLINTDTDEIVYEGFFSSFKKLAKWLLSNYNNTGNEISINDTVYLGVGNDPYIDSQDRKGVPSVLHTYNHAFASIMHGYKGLAKALKAATKYYEGNLFAYC